MARLRPLLLLPLLSALLAASGAASATRKLPAFIRKCSLKDPKIEKCALTQAIEVLPRLMKGDATLRLPSLDPLRVTEVNISTGADASALHMHSRNIVITGLTDTVLRDIGIKPDKYSATSTIPRLEIISDYTVDGRVLVLPIKGNGKANFTFENATMYYEQKYSLEKKGNLHYLKFPLSSASFNCSRAHFYMENLFNGDKALGDAVNSFMNENWRAVVDDLGQPFVDAAATVIQQFSLGVVGNVPFEEIFDGVQ